MLHAQGGQAFPTPLKTAYNEEARAARTQREAMNVQIGGTTPLDPLRSASAGAVGHSVRTLPRKPSSSVPSSFSVDQKT